MCAIIDTNVMNLFANPKNADFQPVRNWILKGKGKIVYGGSTYLMELSKVSQFLKLLENLKKSNKTVILDKEQVDAIEETIIQLAKGLKVSTDFDDPHLIAIVCASGCKVICTHDKRADKHLKNAELYVNYAKPPSIYKNPTHSHLLCSDNIVACCQ